LPELRDYLQTLLRNCERILAATDLDEWAATEAIPSEYEITRLRALIRRTEEAVGDLSVADQARCRRLPLLGETCVGSNTSACPASRHPRWIHSWNVTHEQRDTRWH